MREALIQASLQCGLPSKGVREKELYAVAAARFGLPWTQDQKCAALAGWLAL